MKLLIADDHVLIRKGLIHILTARMTDIEIAEADSGAKVLQLNREYDFDVILLEVEIPEVNGIDTLKKIRSHDKETAVLMLSMHGGDHYAIRALKAGANGFLTKSASPDELIEALSAISSGRKYISPQLAEKLASTINHKGVDLNHEVLSDREFTVMRLIASGKQVSQIARELNLSVPTVSTYRLRILTKMGLKSNAELTHYAISNQLV